MTTTFFDRANELVGKEIIIQTAWTVQAPTGEVIFVPQHAKLVAVFDFGIEVEEEGPDGMVSMLLPWLHIRGIFAFKKSSLTRVKSPLWQPGS